MNTPHTEVIDAVDRLLSYSPQAVICGPVSGFTKKDSFEIDSKSWNKIRRLAQQEGVPIEDDRNCIRGEEGLLLAAALSRGSPFTGWRPSAKTAVGLLIQLLRRGTGLSVRGVR